MSAYTQTLRIWMTATLMNSGTLKWSMPFGVTKRISNILYIIAESMRCTAEHNALYRHSCEQVNSFTQSLHAGLVVVG